MPNTDKEIKTPRRKPPNRKEKKMLAEIAAELPEIIIPIGIEKEFEESTETPGLMIPIIEMGIVTEVGHLGNITNAFREQGVMGVDHYVQGVYKRYEENQKQINEATGTD